MQGKVDRNPETFSEQDEQLSEQIYQLNGIVRDLSKELGSHSPEFSSDLLNNNKHTSGSKSTPKKKRQYNFNLYKDSVYPGDLLAKAWLRKIEEQAKRDCGQLNRNQQRTSKAFSQCGFIYAILKYYAYFVTHLTVLHHQQPKQFKSKSMGTPTTNTQHLNYQDAQLRF